MKVHCTFISRTFIGMGTASWWNLTLRCPLRRKQSISFHSTFTLANPQNCRFYSEWRLAAEEMKRKFKGSSEYNDDESFRNTAPLSTDSEYNHSDAGKNFPSVTADCMGKDDRDFNNDEDKSIRTSTQISRPRPHELPWQKDLAKVYFSGRICRPVQFKLTQTGETFACTALEVMMPNDGPRKHMWLTLEFWNDLAETAVRHLKTYDIVYVSGFLGLRTTAGEDDKLYIYKVSATTLNFVGKRSPDFFQQVGLNNNTSSLHLSKQTVINKDPSLQYKKSQVVSSDSGKNAQDADITKDLWRAFFASPLEWWDNRTNKTNPRIPDFRHKNTGAALWIEGRFSPPWVRSQLAVLDSRKKVSEESGIDISSARSWGSSSSQDSGF